MNKYRHYFLLLLFSYSLYAINCDPSSILKNTFHRVYKGVSPSPDDFEYGQLVMFINPKNKLRAKKRAELLDRFDLLSPVKKKEVISAIKDNLNKGFLLGEADVFLYLSHQWPSLYPKSSVRGDINFIVSELYSHPERKAELFGEMAYELGVKEDYGKLIEFRVFMNKVHKGIEGKVSSFRYSGVKKGSGVSVEDFRNGEFSPSKRSGDSTIFYFKNSEARVKNAELINGIWEGLDPSGEVVKFFDEDVYAIKEFRTGSKKIAKGSRERVKSTVGRVIASSLDPIHQKVFLSNLSELDSLKRFDSLDYSEKLSVISNINYKLASGNTISKPEYLAWISAEMNLPMNVILGNHELGKSLDQLFDFSKRSKDWKKNWSTIDTFIENQSAEVADDLTSDLSKFLTKLHSNRKLK